MAEREGFEPSRRV